MRLFFHRMKWPKRKHCYSKYICFCTCLIENATSCMEQTIVPNCEYQSLQFVFCLFSFCLHFFFLIRKLTLPFCSSTQWWFFVTRDHMNQLNGNSCTPKLKDRNKCYIVWCYTGSRAKREIKIKFNYYSKQFLGINARVA